MHTRKQHAYQIDDLLVVTGSQEVLRDGKSLDLTRLSRKLLIALIEKAPAPLTPAQIADAVWNGRHVSMDTITQRVRLLRRSLGDDASNPRYIALERGLGYRIVPQVHVLELPANVAPERPTGPGVKSGRKATAVATLGVAAALCLALIADAVLVGMPWDVPRSSVAGSTHPTVSLPAQEYFERGEFYYHRRDEGDVQRAEQSYLQAIALAPDYAAPWVSLAAVYNLQGWTDESVAQIQHALERALGLQPDLAIAHARLGRLIYLKGGSRERAQAHIDRALTLAPEDPMVLAIYAGDLELRGEYETAMALQKKVVQMHPASLLHRSNLIVVYMREGLLQDAEAQLQTLLNLHPYMREDLSLATSELHLLRHEPRSAINSLADSLPPEDRFFVMALAYNQMGDGQASDSWLARLARLNTPYAIARYGEAMDYLGMNVPVDDTLRTLLDIRKRQPAQMKDVTLAGEALVHSPFIDQTSPALRRQRMLAVYDLNSR